MERNRDFVYLGVFVWDTGKNVANKRKHGLSFEVATRIFSDPFLLTDYDFSHSDSEHREKHIGVIDGQHVASVISSDRDGLTRIISARKATKTEIKLYEYNAKSIQGD